MWMQTGEMKKKALIVRSISFQQLDKNLDAIVRRFPGYEFHLLTHSHGIDGAANYTSISKVIDYGSRKNFSFFHAPGELKNVLPSYDAIIVPVTNMTGAGFLNVFLMALRIPSHSIYRCNLISEIREIPGKTILFHAFKSFSLSVFSAVLTIPLVIVFLPVMGIYRLGGMLKNRRGRVEERSIPQPGPGL
jgi:hypothetical protein